MRKRLSITNIMMMIIHNDELVTHLPPKLAETGEILTV